MIQLNRVRKVLAFTALGVAALYALAGYMGSSQAIGEHPEWRRVAAKPQDFGLKAELASFNSRDGIALKAWWLPALSAAHGNLVLAHGRDANRSNMLPRANFLVRHGYNVLAVDLRDHGENGGRFISPGYLEARDILGAVDYLRARGEGTPIAVLGHSYGAVAALHAAAQSSEIAAVISDGAFASATEVLANVTEHYLKSPETPRWAKMLLWLSKCPGVYAATNIAFYLRTGEHAGPEMITALPVVSRVHQPVLFISGETGFHLTARERSEDVRSVARDSQIPGGGAERRHNNTYRAAPREYERAVLRFLADSAGVANATDNRSGHPL